MSIPNKKQNKQKPQAISRTGSDPLQKNKDLQEPITIIKTSMSPHSIYRANECPQQKLGLDGAPNDNQD